MKRNFKKKIISAFIFSSLFFVTASGYAFDYSVSYDYSEQNIIISGMPDNKGDFITLQVIKPGKRFDSAEDKDFIYTGQMLSENDFSFDFSYNVSMGKYPARLATSASDEKKNFDLIIVSRTELEGLYNKLNELSETDETGFKNKVKDNIEYLMGRIFEDVLLDETLTNYLEYVKENPLKISESEKNTKVLNTFFIMEELNNADIKDIKDSLETTYITDESFLKDFEDVCDDDKISGYFTDKISEKDLKSLDDYEKILKEALILTAANYGSGYGQLQKITEKYGDVLGITTKAEASLYKKLFGKDFSNGKAYFDAWKEAKSSVGNSSSSSSGGGGGSKNSGSKNNMVVATTPGNNEEKVDAMNVVFDDIDGVEWATVAIHALADKNIINGKEPRKFAPNDAVKREEFVKILIGAMNMSDYSYNENVFSDVSDSAWYVNYVNIANENGIVRGTGNAMFGTGKNITRQDMAVMIYNALKFKNADTQVCELPFEDKESISDYAKEAVAVLYNMGAVNGISNTEFAPGKTATRAQAAKIIYGVIGYLE